MSLLCSVVSLVQRERLKKSKVSKSDRNRNRDLLVYRKYGVSIPLKIISLLVSGHFSIVSLKNCIQKVSLFGLEIPGKYAYFFCLIFEIFIALIHRFVHHFGTNQLRYFKASLVDNN